ncbi:MAG: peptidylprolyl isomerase, partial [bacterium]
MFDLKNKETIQDLTNSILQGTLYEKEIVGKIGLEDISDEEAENYYHVNQERFMQPPKAKISYIRIPVSKNWGANVKPSENERKAAKRKADEAYAMIKDGTEFEVVARKYSADDWSARKLDMYEEEKMQMATLAEVQMHPLHKVIFRLKEGEISKPVEFQDSYYIFKLWEKSGKDYVAFDNVKDVIKQMLVVQKRKELAETLKNELMEKSQLIVNERAVEAMAKQQAEKKTQTEEMHAEHSE